MRSKINKKSMVKTQIVCIFASWKYDLDLVIAVGYRVKSGRAIIFRNWLSDEAVSKVF
jgi:hypothetical protein